MTTKGSLANGAENRFGIERLDEAGIDHADVETLVAKQLGRRNAVGQEGAAADDRAIVAHGNDFALAELQRRSLAGYGFGRCFGIANRTRTFVLERELEHLRQVGFVARSHHRDVRQHSQITEVERAVMRRSVRPCQAAAIEHEGDGQILQRDFLEDLIVRALQKRAVNVDDRSQADFGLAGGKGDGVAFADADVEEAIGKRIADLLELVALAHGGRDHGDARIDLYLMVNRIGRDVREGPRGAAGHANDLVVMAFELRRRVEQYRVFGGRLEAVALFGDHVEQNRSLDLLDHPQILPHAGQCRGRRSGRSSGSRGPRKTCRRAGPLWQLL